MHPELSFSAMSVKFMPCMDMTTNPAFVPFNPASELFQVMALRVHRTKRITKSEYMALPPSPMRLTRQHSQRTVKQANAMVGDGRAKPRKAGVGYDVT